MVRGILLRRLLCSRRSRRLETSSGIGGLAMGATSRVAGTDSRVAGTDSRVGSLVGTAGKVRVAGATSRVATVRVVAMVSRVALVAKVREAGKVRVVGASSRVILRRLLPCRLLLLFRHRLLLPCRLPLFRRLRRLRLRRLRRLGMASLPSRLWGSSQVLHSLSLRVCRLPRIGLLLSLPITMSRLQIYLALTLISRR